MIPGLAQWIKDPALLWLWCRPAAAAPIRPLAWELPYAMGVALKKKKKEGKERKKKQLFFFSWKLGCKKKKKKNCVENPEGEVESRENLFIYF